MISIKNKKILITGASSGIGKALAVEMSKAGAQLVLTSRKKDLLDNVAREIIQECPDIPAPLTIPCDVTNTMDIRRLFNTCDKKTGGIDILINNAGIGVYGEGDMATLEDYREIMEVNYFGAVQCMLAAIPSMKKKKMGTIVNISSVAALHGVPFLGGYGASKAALVAFSQSLRAELIKDGISIVVVYPGYTETEFFEHEKKVGRAQRPEGPYMPVKQVAKSIIKCIEHEKEELVLSLEGKALSATRKLFPGLVRRAMNKIAEKLSHNIFLS